MDALSTGSNGPDVITLQQALASLGYNITADGIFGDGTKAIVMQFQAAHNLPADGVAGPDTWILINGLQDTTKVYGMDISHLDDTINWDGLSATIKFVYCKATQGATFKDPMFPAFISHLQQKQLIMGAYHFLTFQLSAQAQADNFLSCGLNFSAPGVLPPALDVEWQVPDSLNPYILQNRPACVQLVHDWLNIVETKTGRTPVIYTGKSFWDEYLGNPAGFEKYPLWIPSYQTNPPGLPPGWNNYTIWQYNDQGAIPGVASGLDQDLFNGTMDDLKKLALMETAI